MPEPVAPPLERILSRPESGARSIVDMALKRPERPESADSVARPRLGLRLTRKVSNCPMSIARTDWERIVCGTKRMYRTYSGSWRDRFAPIFPAGEEFPRPALVYSQIGHDKVYDFHLAVILSYRQEPLGAISAGDVFAEGFSTLNQFRRYWKVRHVRHGWRPGDLISVVELRPWEEQDDEEQGAWLLRRLYGEWL